jgi:hypothetical protein
MTRMRIGHVPKPSWRFPRPRRTPHNKVLVQAVLAHKPPAPFPAQRTKPYVRGPDEVQRLYRQRGTCSPSPCSCSGVRSFTWQAVTPCGSPRARRKGSHGSCAMPTRAACALSRTRSSFGTAQGAQKA